MSNLHIHNAGDSEGVTRVHCPNIFPQIVKVGQILRFLMKNKMLLVIKITQGKTVL